ncbi:hypothetical protein, partial [Haploplasma axanthum]
MRLYKEYLSDEIINYYYSLALNYKKLTYEDVVRLDLELEDIETLETNLKHKKLNQQIVYGMKVKTWFINVNIRMDKSVHLRFLSLIQFKFIFKSIRRT